MEEDEVNWVRRSGRSGLCHVVGEVDSSMTIGACFVEAAWFEGFYRMFFMGFIWIYGKEIIEFIVVGEIQWLI